MARSRLGIGQIRAYVFREDIMSETKTRLELTPGALTKDIIPDLIHADGPCITLLVAPFSAGGT